MNIERMNRKTLQALRDKIDQRLEEIRQKDLDAVRDRAAKLAADHGLTLDDLGIGASAKVKSVKRRRKVTRWKDKETGVVWAGVGRIPPNFERERAEPLT